MSRILFRRETSISSAAAVLTLSLLLANILGLAKLRILSHLFGASSELGVFLAADRFPSFIFNLFVAGTVSSSFIPVFASYLNRSDHQRAFKVSSTLLNISFLVFGSVSLLLFVFAPQLSWFLSLGRISRDELILMSSLTRILVLAQFFLLPSLFLTAVFQSFDRFLVPALSPILYNLGSILGLVVLSPFLGIYAPAWGAVFGALLHLGFQLPFLRNVGFRHFWEIDLREKAVAEVGRLVVPRALGLAVDQINLLIDTVLSLSLSTSSVVILSFAQRLQNVPVVLFGSTIAQASLPTLSRLVAVGANGRGEFQKILVGVLHQLLYLILPVSIILFVLRLPVVRLAFGTPRFDWAATNLTGYTLAFYSLGIFSQSVTAVLARAFFALKDTRTPVKVGLVTVLTNTGLSLFFIKAAHFNVWSLALSASISSVVNAFLLFALLERRVGKFDRSRLLGPVVKMAFSGLIMGVFIYLPLKILDRGGWGILSAYSLGTLLFDTRYTVNLFFLTVVSAFLGLTFYLLLTSYLKVSQARRVLWWVLRFRNFGRYFFPSLFPE